MNTIEVCLSPLLYPAKVTKENFITVVIDVLRATTSICTALDYGVDKIYPVVSLEEAKLGQDQGLLVAAERNALKIDFADFGNSPFEFMRDDLVGKALVYSSTNGTKNIQLASDADEIELASFLNLDALINRIEYLNKDVVILCSGWKGKYCIEDTLCAGALTEGLLKLDGMSASCDATYTALHLWENAKKDLKSSVKLSAAYKRLEKAGLADVLDYVISLNKSNAVPVMNKNKKFIWNQKDLNTK